MEEKVAALPAAGAVVMGTGIVSVALGDDAAGTLSLVLLGIAALVWALLVGGLALSLVRARGALAREARSPALLTTVAATDVIAARVQMLGWNREADILLAVALCMWIVLVPFVLARGELPAVGVSFLPTVATESLAVVGAVLAHAYGVTWLAFVSFALIVVGLVLYGVTLRAFELRQLVDGGGDHWISGGALAIATLACARLALAEPRAPLATASLALWAAAVAWLPPLVACELAAPRPWSDLRRWSTVFPLGMYAACSFAAAHAAGAGALDDFARAWVWLAFASLVVVFVHLLRRLVRPAI